MILLKFATLPEIILLITLETLTKLFLSVPFTKLIKQILMFGQCFFDTSQKLKFQSIICLDKQSGKNNVSRRFLVKCKVHVAYHLKVLREFCIISGVCPNFFKIAQTTPIRKKSLPPDQSNYRSVSVLINLSRVFENIIQNRGQNFSEISKFLAQNLTVFRKHRTTE